MKIGIIGAGNMGGAIARGLASAGADRYEVAVSNPSPAKLDRLKSECPAVAVSTDNAVAASGADVVIVAVKPWLIGSVLAEIAPVIDFRNQTIVSVAAGVTLDDMWEMLRNYSSDRTVMRAIPNTAISVGESMTFLCHREAAPEKVAAVKSIFDLMGRTEVVEERLIPAATALCSCGIAYAMRYVRAATEGAVELGLYPYVAKEYVLQTLRGAVALLEATGAHPEAEIDRVTTPGGITIKGLNAMEANGFSHSVVAGLKASV